MEQKLYPRWQLIGLGVLGVALGVAVCVGSPHLSAFSVDSGPPLLLGVVAALVATLIPLALAQASPARARFAPLALALVPAVAGCAYGWLEVARARSFFEDADPSSLPFMHARSLSDALHPVALGFLLAAALLLVVLLGVAARPPRDRVQLTLVLGALAALAGATPALFHVTYYLKLLGGMDAYTRTAFAGEAALRGWQLAVAVGGALCAVFAVARPARPRSMEAGAAPVWPAGVLGAVVAGCLVVPVHLMRDTVRAFERSAVVRELRVGVYRLGEHAPYMDDDQVIVPTHQLDARGLVAGPFESVPDGALPCIAIDATLSVAQVQEALAQRDGAESPAYLCVLDQARASVVSYFLGVVGRADGLASVGPNGRLRIPTPAGPEPERDTYRVAAAFDAATAQRADGTELSLEDMAEELRMRDQAGGACNLQLVTRPEQRIVEVFEAWLSLSERLGSRLDRAEVCRWTVGAP